MLICEIVPQACNSVMLMFEFSPERSGRVLYLICKGPTESGETKPYTNHMPHFSQHRSITCLFAFQIVPHLD